MKNVKQNQTEISQYLSQVGSQCGSLLSKEEEILAFQLLEKREADYLQHLISLSKISIPILTSYINTFSNSQQQERQLAFKSLQQITKLLKSGKISQSSKLFSQQVRENFIFRKIQNSLYSTILEMEPQNGSVEWRNRLFKLHDLYIEIRNKIIKSNLRLVILFVSKTKLPRLIPDLIQEGNLGLVKAVEKFNWREEVRFSTYASWWIKQSIRRYFVNKERLIRNPVHVSDLMYQIDKLEEKYYYKTGEPASERYLLNKLKISSQRLQNLKLAKDTTISSLDSTIKENTTYFDIIEDQKSERPDYQLEKREFNEMIERLTGNLSGCEKHIIQLRFSDDNCTLQELGDFYGLSRERIRQIENTALRKMKKMIEHNPKIFKFYSNTINNG